MTRQHIGSDIEEVDLSNILQNIHSCFAGNTVLSVDPTPPFARFVIGAS